jgi:RNA polymerase sigma-70 factor (ECF subfamily)
MLVRRRGPHDGIAWSAAAEVGRARRASAPGTAPISRSSVHTSDIELLHRLQAGDGEAIGLLFDRYASRLLRLAMRIVGDHAEAEDVVHDAFVAVGDRARHYAAEGIAVAASLVFLVGNISIDRKRYRDHRRTRELPH